MDLGKHIIFYCEEEMELTPIQGFSLFIVMGIKKVCFTCLSYGILYVQFFHVWQLF